MEARTGQTMPRWLEQEHVVLRPFHKEAAMSNLTVNTVYEIELCSGELRYWKYLGPDSRTQVWWLDMETNQEFSESSLMYAWRINGPRPLCP